jgi:DNA-directed RNA polymerase subunit RPC12/RpoP
MGIDKPGGYDRLDGQRGHKDPERPAQRPSENTTSYYCSRCGRPIAPSMIGFYGCTSSLCHICATR